MRYLHWPVFILTGALAACGSGPDTTATTEGGSGGDGSGGDGSGGAATTTSTGGEVDDGCVPEARIPYVLSSANRIYSFDPETKSFENLFDIGCDPAPDGTVTWAPHSMAVDRNAIAWVNYVATDSANPAAPVDVGGVLIKVDLVKHQCDSYPTFQFIYPEHFRLGMSFALDAAGGTAESLYVNHGPSPGGANGTGLLLVDMENSKIENIGQFTGSGLGGQYADLIGTGAGELYGFFALHNSTQSTQPSVHLAKIDLATGEVPASTNVTLPEVEAPVSWGATFWGGDFYLFTAPDPVAEPTRTTNVTRVHPGGATDTAYMTNVGFTVIAASASTCAPLTTK